MSAKLSRWLAAPCLAGAVFAIGCDSSQPKATPPAAGKIGSSGASAIALAPHGDPLAPTVIELPAQAEKKLVPAPLEPTTVVVGGTSTVVAPLPSATKKPVEKDVVETIVVPAPVVTSKSTTTGDTTTTTVTVATPAPTGSASATPTGTAPVIKLAPTVDVKVITTTAATPTNVDVKVEMKKPDLTQLKQAVDEAPKPVKVELGTVNVFVKPTATATATPSATSSATPPKKEAAKPDESKKDESKPSAKVEAKPISETRVVETQVVATKVAEMKLAETKLAVTANVAAQPAAKAPLVVAVADTKAAPAAAGFDEDGFIPPQAALAGKSSVPAKVYGVKKDDWNQWGGSSVRNNIPEGKNIATEWNLGDAYADEGVFKKEDATKNVLWGTAVGSQTYGNPVVANGQVYVGTNNGAGWIKRFPVAVDLGCLIAFDEKDGKFLWQHSSEKLPSGRVHDWPMQGICCSPLVEGEKVWFVSSRGLVICLDAKGYLDGEDDGPFVDEPVRLFDVMKNDDPKLDKLEPMLVELKAGKIPDAMRKLFSAAGEEVAADVTVEAGKRLSSFVAKYKTGDVERTIQLQMEGPKLGVYKVLNVSDKDEADVIWQLDMMNELGVSQHNMCSCSVTDAGDFLFVCTSNGVDEGHINLPAPNAPSFIALDKKTGKLLWKDSHPGLNILHGQWSSPAFAVIDGTPQVIFAGGDGWLYSFRGDGGKDGKAELLWSFDANPKTSKYILGGRGTRNEIIATPVIYNDLVYLAVGQDPEHGEGIGHLWCIDPKKRGDISAELAFNLKDPKTPIPHRRMLAVDEAAGEVARPNPNSGVVWHYSQFDKDGNKKVAWEEEMHRTCGTVVIKDDLLYIADFSGLFHCVDATTGVPYWTHDLLAACWGSAMIVDGKVYIGDEDSKISIFKHSKEYEEPVVAQMGNSIYTTPVVANNTLFIANKTHVFAIGPNDGESGEGEKKEEKKDEK